MNNIKDYFPIYENNKNLIYFDNGATTQKPKVLIDSIVEYYSNYNSNIGRGVYKLAQASEDIYNNSKKNIHDFFNSSNYQLVFTSGSTESINIAAHIVSQNIHNKKTIILPFFEHHANILVWQELALKNNLNIYWVKEESEILNPENISQEILQDTFLIAFTHVSNVTGEIIPIQKWLSLSKSIGAISLVDGSQAVCSLELNINKLEPDFYCFSAHKMYGPMGLGILFINSKYINSKPLKLGGGIIQDVTFSGYELLENENIFEAGTPNVANAYAFSKTITWLKEQNWKNLIDYTHELNEYFVLKIKELNISPIIISKELAKTHITSFNLENIHPHDVGTYLAKKNIAIRVGKHCAHPLHEQLNINSSVRVSFGIYNNKEEIDFFIQQLKKCKLFFE